jgi:hypothetical protein
MNKRIVVVARQAGTANAFLPLYEEFRKSDCAVETFAFAQAHHIFSTNRIDSMLIDRFDKFLSDDIVQPSLLLTGTSEYAREDNDFWQWAKSNGIPSLAFVDSWVSYWQRFTPSDMIESRFSCAPDLIAVIDQFMYERMVEYGCDEKKLVVTGSPAFESLRDYVPMQRDSISRTYGENYFVFIGEPFNPRVFGGDEKETLGYTEAEVLTLAVEALDKLERQTFTLVFRPHPRGGHSRETTLVADRHGSVTVDKVEFNSRDLVACARAVIGMTSMLLFEASMMGVPAVSIRPNKRLSSDVIDHCKGIPVVTSSEADDVFREIQKMLSTEPEALPIAKSTLWDVMCSILSRQ